MVKKIFITGTGTDVGKTVITRAVVRAFVNMKIKVAAIKPVESGVPVVNGKPAPHDIIALQTAAHLEDSPINRFNSYMFSDPVSPHLAAANEQKTIKKEPILKLVRDNEQTADLIIIEGAGGLLVPLSDRLLYADLAKEISCGLIIVAPDILGTINATLLTIEAAKSREIPIVGVILNNGPNLSLGNKEAIIMHGKVPVLGTFPSIKNLTDDELLASTAKEHLKLEAIFKTR